MNYCINVSIILFISVHFYFEVHRKQVQLIECVIIEQAHRVNNVRQYVCSIEKICLVVNKHGCSNLLQMKLQMF